MDSAAKTMLSPGRGGRRQGSGRKPLPEGERKDTITIVLRHKDKLLYDKLKAMDCGRVGGLRFIDWWMVDALRSAASDFGLL